MGKVTIREATLKDLPILLQFEQGVIAAERPFDHTLKNPANYYDLKMMIAASHIRLIVAEVDKVIVASGYARIESAKHYL